MHNQTFQQKNSKQNGGEKVSMAERIKTFLDEFLDSSYCFSGKNTNGLYITWTDIDGISHTDMVDSDFFKAILRSMLETNVADKIYSESELRKVIEYMKDKIRLSGKTKMVVDRVAFEGDTVYYDMNDAEGSVIGVNNEDVILMHKEDLFDKEFCFYATSSMSEQVSFGKETEVGNLVDLLKPYLNLSEDELKLLIITVLTFFIRDIPKPIILLEGGKGSGKTTLTNIIQRIVNPSNHSAFVMPKNKEDLIVALVNNYLIAIDNASALPKGASDLLCSAVTGASASNRKLFTDNNPNVVSFQNCILINGIDIKNAKPDFYDRAIKFRMKKLKGDYKLSKSILQSFEKDLPVIMKSMFITLSEALAVHKTLDTYGRYRMADYVQWARAISIAMFGDDEVVLKAYENNRAEITDCVMEDNPVAVALKVYLESVEEFPVRMKPSDLLADVESKVREYDSNINNRFATLKNTDIRYAVRHPKWPKSPQAFSGELKKLVDNFEEEGYIVEVGIHRSDGDRITVIDKVA